MKIVRLQTANAGIVYGSLGDDGAVRRIEGDIYGDFAVTSELVTGKLLAPIAPTNIFGIGLNYRRHAEETGGKKMPEYPVLFMKSTGSVANPDDPILIPTHLASHEVDYECELAVVIGRAAKNVSREHALDYVLGYTCANDVSARDWQLNGGAKQWCRGKTFDTFCPLGPCLVTPDEIPDPNSLRLSTQVNGERLQDWTTSDMIFSVAEIIEFLSGSTTLTSGSIILTGTPHGVGMARTPPRWLQPNDVVTIEIEKIGRLVNPVALEPV